MSGVYAVQKQSLAEFFNIAVRLATLFKRDSNTGVFLRNLQNFLKHLFYRTPLLSWLLQAVSCVNQWKYTLKWKFMLPRKKLNTWTVLLRLVILDKEYSSEVFQTLLAVSHFNKVTVAEVFCKKGVPENFANHRCFLVNFTKFSRTPFFIEHLRWLLLKS